VAKKKGRTDAGGRKVDWVTGDVDKFDVTFVSRFDGRVHGVERVAGKRVDPGRGVASFVIWEFDGMRGFADMVDGKG